jgi:hypothetical protein
VNEENTDKVQRHMVKIRYHFLKAEP